MNLFGHCINPRGRASLREQVRAVLEKEILSGRWQVGDRLPTVRELAEMSGVSISPVTQALSALVDDGYLLQQVGRGTFLRSVTPGNVGGTGAVGVIYGGAAPGQKTSAGEAIDRDLVFAVSEELTRRGLAVRVFHEDSLESKTDRLERVLASSLLQGLDGALNVGTVSKSVLGQARALRIPLVCVGDPYPPAGVPFVAGGTQQAVWEAVDILHHAGHRQVGLAYTFADVRNRVRRLSYEAFFAACSEHSLTVAEEWLVDAGPRHGVNIEAIVHFLSSASKPTGLVCTHNHIGQVISDLAPLVDVEIPRELSVILITDNLDFGDTFHPPLSTLVVPTQAYAKQAVETLSNMVHGDGAAGDGGVVVRPVRRMRASVMEPCEIALASVK